MQEDLKCPFCVPLIAADYGCMHGAVVARRGGPDIACQNISGHDRCMKLHEGLISATLDANAMNYDLNYVPHSMLVKVQYGGLLGLQTEIDSTVDRDLRSVKDIYQLVQHVLQHYDGEVPFDRFVEPIMNYRLKRRGRRHS